MFSNFIKSVYYFIKYVDKKIFFFICTHSRFTHTYTCTQRTFTNRSSRKSNRNKCTTSCNHCLSPASTQHTIARNSRVNVINTKSPLRRNPNKIAHRFFLYIFFAGKKTMSYVYNGRRLLSADDPKATHFVCNMCTRTHVWLSNVSFNKSLMSRQLSLAYPTACCIEPELRNKRALADMTPDHASRLPEADALLGSNACNVERNGKQRSAANICVQCAPIKPFILCDSCVCNVSLVHNPNHTFLVLLDDAMKQHQLQTTWPMLAGADNIAHWTWVQQRYNRQCVCSVCDTDIVDTMYVSVENENRRLCRSCYVETIQQDKL